MSNAETALMNDVLLALGRECPALCRAWRQQAGKFRQLYGDQVVTVGVPGAADLTGVLLGGRRLEIEVKTPGEKQRPTQINYEAMIRALGGLYVVVDTPEAAVRAVRSACGLR